MHLSPAPEAMPIPWRSLNALVLIVLAGCGSDAQPAIVQELRDGGLVLVMRHAATESATPPSESLRSCDRQRNLSAAGREQARAIGEAMRALDVPIGDVRSSPMCRARDTARLAFGRVEIDRDLVSPGVIGTIEADDRRAAALREMVHTAPPDGTNTVLVTHTGNIGAAFEESVDEGELLAYDRGRLVGTLSPGELARAADAPPG
ncbi:MAG: histidine phosphatase family protein [Solirubrobacteraceae bacterium]